MQEEPQWTLKTTEENSYLRVLEKCYKNIRVEIHKESSTIMLTPEGSSLKGAGKALSLFLGTQGVPEEDRKSVTDVLELRPQQMIAYSSEKNDISLVLAVAKIRKWIIEGQITNKLTENIAEKLYSVHEKYQEAFCSQTKEVSIPKEHIPLIVSFYKVMVRSGCIESIIDHPEADTLYIENVDFLTEKRTIVSGLKGKVEKSELSNRNCLFSHNLKPVSFKSTKSYGMILFAKDTEGGKGSPIFTEKSGERLMLQAYPLHALDLDRITPGDCTKKTLEVFFSRLSVKNSSLLYEGLPVQVEGSPVVIPGVCTGTIS